MITPLLARPADTSAICSGDACVSNCPIEACPSRAFDLPVSGNVEVAAAGRSIGGVVLNPNCAAPCCMIPGPSTSAPISAKDELQETRRISGSGPPHVSPPKFEIGFPSGGLYSLSRGEAASGGGSPCHS